MLKLVMFGQPHIILDGKPVTGVRNKARGLLFYLAFNPHMHERQWLGRLLWPEDSETTQKNYLRGELHELKKYLGEHLESVLIRDHDRLAFNREAADCEVDVAAFEASLRAHKLSLQQLRETVDLYRGPFLDGFVLDGLDEFNRAVEARRRRLADHAFDALRCLVIFHAQEHEHGVSLSYAERVRAIYPLSRTQDAVLDDESLRQQDWHETANRLTMIVLALNGQWEQALARYNDYAARLPDWFGDDAEPSLAMTALRRRIQKQEEVHTLLKEYLPYRPALPDAPKGPPFQVPNQRVSLVGRDELTDDLAAALRESPGRYSLVGMGGVGKSSLAVHLGHRLRADYPDGVLWANLAVSEPLSILQSWAKAFDADFHSLADVETRADAFRALTADRRILLILDNAVDVASVEPLLPNSPRAAVLLTTRDLDVANALNCQIVRLEPLSPESSRRLLAHLIGRERSAGQKAALDSIVEALDNLPLAIEITGQRLRSRPRQTLAECAAIIGGVRSRLDTLRIQDHAVRAAFEQSWERMIDRQQTIFAMLAVFEQRPFTEEALAHVAQIEAAQASQDLADLYTLSLVMEHDAAHYRLHALLADFALEKLSATPDANAAFHRMAEYYLNFARDRRHDLPALESEWSQVMSGMAVAHRRQHWPLVLAYAQALEHAWFMLGRFAEAHDGFAWACEAAEALGDSAQLAWGLCQRGRTYVEQNNVDDARSPLEQSLELNTVLDDTRGIAEVKYYLGRIAIVQENYLDGERLLGESVFLHQQLGNPVGVAESFYILEDIPYYADNFDIAQWLAEGALNIYQDASNAVGVIRCYGQLSNVAFKLERYAHAEQYCLNALAICDEIHEQAERAIILYNLADAYLLQGKFDLAMNAIQESLYLLHYMGDQLMEARALRQQADIYLALRQTDLALQSCQQSLALFQRQRHTKNIARALHQQMRIYVALGQVDLALQTCQEDVLRPLGKDAASLQAACDELRGKLAQAK